MDRHDLHGVVVALDPADDRVVLVVESLEPGERREQLVGPAAAIGTVLMEQLDDVGEVGEVPLALRAGRHIPHHVAVGRDRGSAGGDPAPLHDRRQGGDGLLDRTDRVVGERTGVAE
jgi:hypothetical protein